MAKNRISRVSVIVASMLALSAIAIASPAHAQWFDETYPGFFSLQSAGILQATIFGGGFVSDKYVALQQGVQVEQSVTPYIGFFARATGYQLWIGNGFESPLAPGSGNFPRLNYGRFQGGADFTLFPGTHLYVSGGARRGGQRRFHNRRRFFELAVASQRASAQWVFQLDFTIRKTASKAAKSI